MKKALICLLSVLMLLSFVGCSVEESSPEAYGDWKQYHTAPSFLPESIEEYTVNDYSYTLYNYMDTCYEIYLDITVDKQQFDYLLEAAKHCSEIYEEDNEFGFSGGYTEIDSVFSKGYKEIVFTNEYERGETDSHDNQEQVWLANINKVIYNPETLNIIYVSFCAEDAGVHDVEKIAYFNRFSITPSEYVESL
ncbi:MAG: hypothetical protein UH080_05680 [Ruminococcus sp.]|nr:hypothetical protein [Ruminococcus sp.]